MLVFAKHYTIAIGVLLILSVIGSVWIHSLVLQFLFEFQTEVVVVEKNQVGDEVQTHDLNFLNNSSLHSMDGISQAKACEDYQVAYYPDDDITKSLKCGDCIPGSSGIDTREFCNVDEYCTDEGTCQSISNHPLFYASCPRELGSVLSKDGFCGPGLRCLQHQCRQCITGMQDYADGKVCIGDVWTYNTLNIGVYNPTVIFLTSFVVLVLINMLCDCCIDTSYSLLKRRRKRFEENYKTFYQYIISSGNQLNDSVSPNELSTSFNNENHVKNSKTQK